MACPLSDCRNADVQPKRPTDGADRFDFDCPRCGQFSMTQSFYAASAAEFPKHLPELMEGLRRYFKAENEKAVRPLIHEGNWQQAAEKFKPSVWER